MLKKQAMMDIPVQRILKLAVQLEHQQFVTYMLEKQAVTDIPVQHILKPAVQLEHQQFVIYMLEKQAMIVMLWYDKTTLYQHQYGR